jgi:TetR/AcrR family transcriptional regulator, repressor for neighboring sulfatase
MPTNRKPSGRNEVKAAILQTAAALFAQKGVASVSVREIAHEANVNHGLVHRHFGSKENLRRQVQDHLVAEIMADIGDPATSAEGLQRAVRAVRKHPWFWRVLARTLLDDHFEGSVQSMFPFLRRQVQRVEKDQAAGILQTGVDPRVVVGGGVALVLGLLVFRKYLLPGTFSNLEDESNVIDRIISEWMNVWREHA